MLMNLVVPCLIGCRIFWAVTELGEAAVTRYISLTECLGCWEILVMVSPGLGVG